MTTTVHHIKATLSSLGTLSAELTDSWSLRLSSSSEDTESSEGVERRNDIGIFCLMRHTFNIDVSFFHPGVRCIELKDITLIGVQYSIIILSFT